MKSVVAVESGRQEVRGLSLRALTLAFVLCVLVLWPCGCRSFAYPGETGAEAHRRHKRTLRVNSQQMMADIDTVLMLDRPSHLSDRRLP